MNNKLKSFLQIKAINRWGLFCFVTIPVSLVILLEMMDADLSSGPGVSSMIGFSVRWAVPLLFIVLSISSIQILFPGPLSNWLLRNRKYIGLCFAVAMTWQGLFIFLMSTFHREYYFQDVYLLRDELEGSIGYIFLAAMVATSFRVGSKHISATQWKLIHRWAIYFLWSYAFSVYWWNLFYYDNPGPLDYIYYWGGFTAMALRIAAWGKKRHTARLAMMQNVSADSSLPAFKILGSAVIAFGLLVAATGLTWQEPTTNFITSPKWSSDLVLWLPFWPFEPYFSLLIISLGVLLVTLNSSQKKMNQQTL